MLPLGISQISGASRTSVGGYCEPEPEDEKSEQFDVSDRRTLDEVVSWLMELGYIPSFCTACYREGRTGDLDGVEVAPAVQPELRYQLGERAGDGMLGAQG